MRITCRIILLAFLAGVVLVGCRGRHRHAYYRHAEVDCRHVLVGRYPVDSVETMSINCYHFVYDKKDRPVTVEYLRNGLLHNSEKFGVVRINIEYWTDWFILPVKCERWKFFNECGDKKANKDGVYSFELVRARLLKTIMKRNSNTDRKGVLEYEYSLDLQGRIIGKHTLEDFQKREEPGDTFPRYVYKLDECDNLIEVKREGDTTTVVRWMHEYDSQGNRVQTASYDKNRNPVASRSFGVPVVRFRYDENGYLTEESYHDRDGNLTEGRGGFAVVKFSYNRAGDPVNRKYLSTQGELINHNITGVAEIRYEYMENGRHVKRYFGSNGRPCEHKVAGIAEMHRIQDDRGRITEKSFYGIDGKLKVHENDGFAMMRGVYDEDGYLTEVEFRDHRGELIQTGDGYAVWRCKRDENHRIAETTVYDKSGEPTDFAGTGIFRYTYKYDRRGNVIENRFYGPDGELVNNDEGFAVYEVRLNRRGRIQELRFYDKDGNAVDMNNR